MILLTIIAAGTYLLYRLFAHYAICIESNDEDISHLCEEDQELVYDPTSYDALGVGS